MLLHLAADPYPDVSDLAMKVLNSIAYKVCVLPMTPGTDPAGLSSAQTRLRTRHTHTAYQIGTTCPLSPCVLLCGRPCA